MWDNLGDLNHVIMQPLSAPTTRMHSHYTFPGGRGAGDEGIPAQEIQLLLVLGEQEFGVVHDLLQIGEAEGNFPAASILSHAFPDQENCAWTRKVTE